MGGAPGAGFLQRLAVGAVAAPEADPFRIEMMTVHRARIARLGHHADLVSFGCVLSRQGVDHAGQVLVPAAHQDVVMPFRAGPAGGPGRALPADEIAGDDDRRDRTANAQKGEAGHHHPAWRAERIGVVFGKAAGHEGQHPDNPLHEGEIAERIVQVEGPRVHRLGCPQGDKGAAQDDGKQADADEPGAGPGPTWDILSSWTGLDTTHMGYFAKCCMFWV